MTLIRIPLTREQYFVLLPFGHARHVVVNDRGDLVLPITQALFEECCRQQRPGETVADVLIRAIVYGLPR